MPTSKSIFELVVDAVQNSLAGVTRTAGFVNTLDVHRESRLGLGPAPTDPNDRYVIIVPGENVRHDGSDPQKPECMNADDYTQVVWLDCYSFDVESDDSPADGTGHSIAADIIKRLNADFETWVHPDDGTRLVIYPVVRFATPLELQQSQYRGIVVRLELFVRTKQFDPFKLPWQA